MILKIEEVKEYIGLTINDYDVLIAALIRSVQNEIHTVTRNGFIDPRFELTHPDVSVVAAANIDEHAVITLHGADVKALGFYGGQDLHFISNGRNNARVTVAQITPQPETEKFTLELGDDVIGEANVKAVFSALYYPPDIKRAALQMTVDYFNAAKEGGGGIEKIASETVGEYSVSYATNTNGAAMYPASIQRVLRAYTKPRFFGVGG